MSVSPIKTHTTHTTQMETHMNEATIGAVQDIMHCHKRKIVFAAQQIKSSDPLSIACLIQAKRIARRQPTTPTLSEIIALSERLRTHLLAS